MSEVNREFEQAFCELHTALHPDGADIAYLLAEGLSASRIQTLYPYDFEEYVPVLQALLSDKTALPQLLGRSSKIECTLSVATIEVAGYELVDDVVDLLEDAYASEAMLELHRGTYSAYVNNNFPLPKPPKYHAKLSRKENAGANVENLLRNFFYSGWLIANWNTLNLTLIKGNNFDVWAQTVMDETARERLAAEVLRVFKTYWQPLLKIQVDAA